MRAAVVALQRRPLADRPLVAVFGGSLGARRINEATAELYGLWRDRPDLTIHHVSGAAGYDSTSAAWTAARRDGDTLDYRLLRYEDDMPGLYAATTVAVCRAGATTVAELAAAGVPSVLVPLPGAPGDHQTRNAEALVGVGAAVLVPRRRVHRRPPRRRARAAAGRPGPARGDGRRRPHARPPRRRRRPC